MAKKASGSRNDILAKATAVLQNELGYPEPQHIEIDGEPCVLAISERQPLVLVYVPDDLSQVTGAHEEMAIQLAAVVDSGPADYVWATSSGEINDGFIYSWLPEKECQVSQIPPFKTAVETKSPSTGTRVRVAADPIRYKGLQQEFDSLHEKIYASREPVDGANDIIAQICKCVFLKMHLEQDPDFRIEAGGPLLQEVFKPDYIRKHKEKAVGEIKKAFDTAKNLPQYKMKDDFGRSFDIFDPQDFIKFNRPETFALLAEMLGNHHLKKPEETGIEDDIIGRAFDVMLRAKFESKGGMGIYLTPQQVRDAMVQMAFHDILKENRGAITHRDPKTNEVTFRVCDPACGSAGFLVTAMIEVRKYVDKLLGLNDSQRTSLLKDIYTQGFCGADSSPNMVLMARINMALHGDPKARIFRVENSLNTQALKPETCDLILTNPPFKKGGVREDGQKELLEFYRSGIVDGAVDMAGDTLCLGAKPDSKGVWKPVRGVDPAVLFIDRCLQLLKPGGRLLIVLPDGILCNSGDRYVREYLMGQKDENTGRFIGGKAVVKAVVSLPPVTFRLSGAGAKTSFLYLQKKRPGDEQGAVFMAVANNVGFDVKQNKEVVTGENELVKIVEAYKAGPPTENSGKSVPDSLETSPVN